MGQYNSGITKATSKPDQLKCFEVLWKIRILIGQTEDLSNLTV